tara:strand:- start:8389 stop:8826 length:438 start_codon:yes stop_codon:yes gene_type:complete
MKMSIERIATQLAQSRVAFAPKLNKSDSLGLALMRVRTAFCEDVVSFFMEELTRKASIKASQASIGSMGGGSAEGTIRDHLLGGEIKIEVSAKDDTSVKVRVRVVDLHSRSREVLDDQTFKVSLGKTSEQIGASLGKKFNSYLSF